MRRMGICLTSLLNDVEGAVDDVVELEGVVRLREALQVQRGVLSAETRDTAAADPTGGERTDV